MHTRLRLTLAGLILTAVACGRTAAPSPTAPPPRASPPPASVTTPPPSPTAPPPVSSRIAFTSYRDGNADIYAVNPDGSDLARLTSHSRDDTHPAWSPDGTKIAFASDRDRNWEIYVMNADGGGVLRLTQDPEVDSDPTWSPDGRQIAFTSTRDGFLDRHVYAMNADGSDVRQITPGPGFDVDPAWSPEGQQIAFASERDGNRTEIYVIDLDSGVLTRLTNHSAGDWSPAWSPDGRWIAFLSDRGGAHDVYLMEGDGSGIVRLTDGAQANYAPAWSPDGQQIAFDSERDGNTEIYLMDLDNRALTSLTDDPAIDWSPAWSWAGRSPITSAPLPGLPATATAPGGPQTPVIPNTPQSAAAPHFRNGQQITLTGIEMVSPSDGWGVSGPFVLRTRDGGQTWREVTPPGVSSATEAYGAFLDAENAWVVFVTRGQLFGMETVIWHTADGGLTWSASAPIFPEWAIGDKLRGEFYALDPVRAWVAFRGFYAGAGPHFSAHFFRTSNAGASWEPLEADIGVDYTGMAFADPNVGWLTWQTTGPYAAAPPEYAVTRDGGVTWDTRTLPPPEGQATLFEDFEYSEPYGLNLLSDQSVRLLVASWWGDRSTGYLYATEDGGEDWQTYPLPPEVQASEAQLIFFDATNALLLGREMYRTGDGGETWVRVKAVAWDGQFSFVDPLHGWAVARAGDDIALVVTTNGGSTWAELEPRAVH